MNLKNMQLIVPFSDFVTAHDEVRRDVESALIRVAKSGQYIMGKELSAFEKELAEWLGVEAVVGVGNGTDALALAFMALGVKIGDEIVTTDLTALPTITAIQQVGAIPVPVDIDPNTGLLDVKKIGSAITARTCGIVPVHLYGRSCDMTAIVKIASENNLWVVEDCAQAIGACHSGRSVGTFGTMGTLSFYPTKNLGAYGDGGAVLCQDQEFARKIRSLRNYGQIRPNEHTEQGINSRLDEIQAAVLRAKLPYLKGWIDRRIAIAERYQKELPRAILPANHTKEEHVYHLFPVLVPNRDHFCKQLRDVGVETMTHYPVPVHRQPVMEKTVDDQFPAASRWSADVLSIPLNPHLTDKSVCHVIESINKLLEEPSCRPH